MRDKVGSQTKSHDVKLRALLAHVGLPGTVEWRGKERGPTGIKS